MGSVSKRLLITGIESFTGKYVREIFETNGYDVYGTVLNSSTDDHVYTCDMTKPHHIDAIIEKIQPDIVIHLAAITFVPDGDSLNIYEVNLFATLNLLDALIKYQIPLTKVILPSSSNVYGNIAIESITENECPQPLSHYALSKYAMEQMARNYFTRLPIVIARPFNYTGAGQTERFVIPKIVAHFRDKKSILELGNIDIYRDFSDVRDVARAYLLLCESSLVHDVINIASGHIYSLREMITMAEEASGHRLDITINPAFVRANEIERLGGDNSRLRALGWSNAFEMKETIAWMLAHG